MQSIKLRSHVGSDGILHLEIPLGITDQEIEVMVIYQQLEPSAQLQIPEELGCPDSFLSRHTVSVRMIPLLSILKVTLKLEKKQCEVFARY